MTREIAGHLAKIAKTLEGPGHHPELVAGFLTRCLFSMFAEDVGLLPQQDGKRAFTALLETLQKNPQQFVPLLTALWPELDSGGVCPIGHLRETIILVDQDLLRFANVWACLLYTSRCV